MKVFSFCIYGNNRKYYYGLKENYRLINKNFPDFKMYLYVGNPYSKELLNILNGLDITIIYTEIQEGVTTICRYLPARSSAARRKMAARASQPIAAHEGLASAAAAIA